MKKIQILALCLLLCGQSMAQQPAYLTNWFNYISTTLINGPVNGGTKLYMGNLFDSVAAQAQRYALQNFLKITDTSNKWQYKGSYYTQSQVNTLLALKLAIGDSNIYITRSYYYSHLPIGSAGISIGDTVHGSPGYYGILHTNGDDGDRLISSDDLTWRDNSLNVTGQIVTDDFFIMNSGHYNHFTFTNSTHDNDIHFRNQGGTVAFLEDIPTSGTFNVSFDGTTTLFTTTIPAGFITADCHFAFDIDPRDEVPQILSSTISGTTLRVTIYVHNIDGSWSAPVLTPGGPISYFLSK